MNRSLLLLTAGNLVVGTGSLAITGILAPIAAELGVTVAGAGQSTTAYAAAFALGAPAIAMTLGHLDRRAVLLAGLVVFTAASLLGAVAPSFEVLLASRVLAGLGAAAFSPNAVAVASAVVAPERRGWAIALVFGGWTLAGVFGVPLGTWLGLHAGWRWALALVAGMGLAVVLASLKGLPRDVRLPPTDLRRWAVLVHERRYALSLSVTAVATVGSFVLFSFMGPFLAAGWGLGGDAIASTLMLFGAAGVAGNLASGRAVDRFGPKRVAEANLAGVAAALGLVALAFASGAVVPLILGVLLWGAAVFSINTAQQARLVDLDPAPTGIVLPANSSSLYVGQALGAAAGGGLLAAAGYGALPIAGAALLGAALLASRLADEAGPAGLGARP